MAKGALSNQLLGRIVQRDDDLPHHSDLTGKHKFCENCRGDAFNAQSCWPFDQEPNASGQFLATIEACWAEDGRIKIAIRSVMTGHMAFAWLHHVMLLEKK